MGGSAIGTVLRALAITALMLAARCTLAQPYPNHPIKLVVPFAPGGSVDFVARTIQSGLAEQLGQPVVIDNKVGAGGIIAAEFTARQAGDGYTVLLSNVSIMAVFPIVHPHLSYDPAKDFAPVGMTATTVHVAAIHPKVPANTLDEFIAYAKANPGKVAAGVGAGTGSLVHFTMEMFRAQAGIDLLVVPYKASAPAINDLLGGQIQLLIDSGVMPHVKSGRLKAIAVSGNSRLPTLPDTPTFKEAGFKGFNGGWHGLVVPATTPPAVIRTLSEALMKTLAQTDVKEKLTAQGFTVTRSTPEEFSEQIRADRERAQQLARTVSIKLE